MSGNDLQPVGPSPAREALANNLDTDSNLTLCKKKSWFGSLRNVVSKGALSAKAAVDSIRVEQNKELQADDSVVTETETRKSTDSDASTTPLVKSGSHRDSTPRSKSVLSSLRNHLPHGPKHHHKRSSLCSVSARSSSAMSEIAGPEKIASGLESDSAPVSHSRKGSLANSLAGSLRGLGRKSKVAAVEPELSAQQTSSKSSEEAGIYPLPSSPINIPNAAPVLELDLGPTGFTSPIFKSSSAKDLKREELKLEDPANITGVPKSYRLHHMLDEVKPDGIQDARAVTPSDLLATQYKLTDESDDNQLLAPATPMPGTNFSLEVDGVNSNKSDKSQVFERSVTPVNEKKRKELRSMRSLDAMAESCSIAHAADEAEAVAAAEQEAKLSQRHHVQSPIERTNRARMSVQEYFDVGNVGRKTGIVLPDSGVRDEHGLEPTEEVFTSLLGSPTVSDSPELKFYTPRLQSVSRSTTQPCPDDWEPLSRQHAQQASTEHDGNEDPTSKGCDSIANSTGMNMGLGPPSPTRSLALPFRPKTSSAESAMATVASSDATSDHGGDINNFITLEDVQVPTSIAPVTQPNSKETGSKQRRDSIAEPQRIYYEKRTTAWGDVEFIEYGEAQVDPDAVTQDLAGSDIPSSASGSMHGSESYDGSPHGGPLMVPELYQYIQSNQAGSPGGARSRTTHTAGLGDAGYKFTLDNWWPRSTATTQAPNEQPQTPSRRHLDASIDSISTNDENKHPRISPVSSDANRTPSWGNRLDFDLGRSERNMRYNSLQPIATPNDETVEAATEDPAIHFATYNSEAIDADAFAHADFEHAYASSHAGTPRKDSKAGLESNGDAQKAETLGNTRLEDTRNRPKTDSPSPGYNVVISPSSTSSQLGVPLLSRTNNDGRAVSNSGSIDTEDTEADISLSSVDLNALKASEFVPSTPGSRPRNSGYPNPSEDDSMLEPYRGMKVTQSLRETRESESSAGTPSPWRIGAVKGRVISTDTLDDSLRLFSSPSSGYQAGKSSASPPSKTKVSPPSRYRSLRQKASTRQPLEEPAGNAN